MTWTLLVAMAARSCRRRRTAPLQLQGQLGGDKRLLPPDGGVRRRLVVVVVAVAVGEALRQVEEEAPGGVEVQVLGHPPQQGDGVPTPQQLVRQLVRGVQEAVAGEQAAQLGTPGGAAPIRRRKAAGTCDA